MSETNTQGGGRDDESSSAPGSSSSGQAADQAPIRERPMRQPRRGGVMKKIIADFLNRLDNSLICGLVNIV